MTYEVVVVEDDKHHQERLTELLGRHAEFRLIGIAGSIQEAKKMLALIKPDLVFLDVLLPPSNSFELLESFELVPFEIIFTTSYEEYAVKAFRLSAIDYLLKPVSEAEFDKALEKFKLKKSKGSEHIKNLLANLRTEKPKIALPSLTGFLFVSVTDIVRCESDNTYTTFFTHDKRKIIVSRTLKECEQILDGYGFYRVHNSHLINLDYMVEYIKGEGGIVKMTDGSHVDVSRRRKDEFLRLIR